MAKKLPQDIAREEDVALSVVDASEVEKLKKKEKKVQWLMQIIKEHGLENDKEFMDAIVDAIEGVQNIEE